MTNPFHRWLFSISVENDFRNAYARIEYRWFSPVVTRFEAVWVAGPMPPRAMKEHRIHVVHNEQEVGDYASKAEALGHLRRLLSKCPTECRAEFESHADFLWRALHETRL